MSTSTATPESISQSTSDEASPSLNILIADKFESTGIEALQAEGCAVVCDPELNPDSLPDAVAAHDPDVLIVRSTKVPEPVFEAAKNLSLVIRAGAGYDNINVAAASARGVFVANCPGKNAIAVAEIAWGLILACDRRIPDQTIDLRNGIWNKKEYAKAKGLYGRTLGIIGMGRIGREIATRGKAFGMNIIGWSRSLTQETADELGIGYCSSAINLAKMSDVVSVNLAATPETRHFINESFCNSMKDEATLINTSRGSVVDEETLTRAIREKGLRAGLDVYAGQPSPGDKAITNAIVNEPNVFGTHHCGASTDQAQLAIAAESVRIVKVYASTGVVPNCVNRAASTPATTLLTVRHLNRPGVLAHVFDTLGRAGINVEEMENIIYKGAEAACARIQLDDAPSADIITAITANEFILSVNLATIPSS